MCEVSLHSVLVEKLSFSRRLKCTNAMGFVTRLSWVLPLYYTVDIFLGDQELKLKRRRDLYQTKFADLTKKMKCSTEALQQIAHITKATGPSSHGNSTNGHDKSTNKVANGKHQEATVV